MTDITSLLGYESQPPSHQHAIDLFPGAWVSKFPPLSGLAGGEAAHFDDTRVTWVASVLGGLQQRSILELGPFEAYNTYQFQMAGAGSVTSIEASRINFLKCLVVKNIFGLNATFLLGDFQPFLRTTPSRFDLCWASGVLYHMRDPIALLSGIRAVANCAFIWTHYYDNTELQQHQNLSFFDPSRNQAVQFAGREIVLHHRNYNETLGLNFAGGEAFSYWMTRDDIMYILRELGYEDIQVGVDNPKHPSGPAMYFLARAPTTRRA